MLGVLNVIFELKFRIYRSLKSLICLKWIRKKFSTTLHTQFNFLTKPATPFNEFTITKYNTCMPYHLNIFDSYIDAVKCIIGLWHSCFWHVWQIIQRIKTLSFRIDFIQCLSLFYNWVLYLRCKLSIHTIECILFYINIREFLFCI